MFLGRFGLYFSFFWVVYIVILIVSFKVNVEIIVFWGFILEWGKIEEVEIKVDLFVRLVKNYIRVGVYYLWDI